eukprot:m.125664 g.125664  ORF g.125664 m.125664 type:complete len:61 (-) comp9432_c1_seq1:41-223(-)
MGIVMPMRTSMVNVNVNPIVHICYTFFIVHTNQEEMMRVGCGWSLFICLYVLFAKETKYG